MRRNAKHSKLIQTMMEYCHSHCVCVFHQAHLTQDIAPPNEVEQPEVKTDCKKV